jgi:hypothetical protein
MDDKLLKELLNNKKEEDRLEFKQRLEIYQSDGKISDFKRDEMIKDILGLANGNSHIIRETKYLIVGADNSKFDDNGIRALHDVSYGVPAQSEIIKWLNSACSPAIVGLECDIYPFNGVNLFIIVIPPTFDIHETTRELNASGHFNKYTVFMRQDEHTVPASVRDGITIQRLKHLHRQEVANPSAGWLGAVIGGIVTLLLWGGESKITQTNSNLSISAIRIVAGSIGAFLGAEIGWLVQEFNSTRYAWRYWTNWKRLGFVVSMFILGTIIYFWQFK